MSPGTTSASRPGDRSAGPWAVSALDALGAALAAQRPLAYNVNLARIAGCVKAGVFASQLLYWSRVGVNVEERQGWVFKTREQWLIETGLLQEQKIGVPPKACFRICARTLGMQLAALIEAESVQWTLFDLRSGAAQVRALLGRNLALYRVMTELCDSIPAAVMLSKALALQKAVLAAQLDRLARRQGASKHYQSPGIAPTIPEAWEHHWFHLGVRQWELETGLSAAQQRSSGQKLCRIDLLEEALQTHPRRQAFIRVNLLQLSHKVQERLRTSLQKPADGRQGGDPLSALARGLGSARTSCPSVVPGNVWTDCPNQAGSDGLGNSANQQSSLPGSTRPNWPSDAAGNFAPGQQASSAAVSNPAASFPQTANLGGAISQGKRPLLTPPAASFRISQRPAASFSRPACARGIPDYRFQNYNHHYKPCQHFLAPLAAAVNTTVPGRCFNDKKITAHHAIIPTNNPLVQMSAMAQSEQLVYDMIRQRYLAQFLGEHQFTKTVLQVDCVGQRFSKTGESTVHPGWRRADPQPPAGSKRSAASDAQEAPLILPASKVGDAARNSKVEVLTRKTEPPKRYTEGSLIAAMEAIDKEIDDPRFKQVMKNKEKAGIGTDATRASIIASLFLRQYIANEKNGCGRPTRACSSSSCSSGSRRAWSTRC